jgi:universal stress protein A
MQDYRHILVAMDATEQSAKIVTRALKLATASGARLSMLKVLEHLPASIPVDPVPPEGVDKIEWFRNHARDELKEFARRLGHSEIEINVAVGSPKDVIADFAREQAVDLIVVGAHERHGIALLWGSTTDSVLHHAPCDVLAVHVPSL